MGTIDANHQFGVCPFGGYPFVEMFKGTKKEIVGLYVREMIKYEFNIKLILETYNRSTNIWQHLLAPSCLFTRQTRK